MLDELVIKEDLGSMFKWEGNMISRVCLIWKTLNLQQLFLKYTQVTFFNFPTHEFSIMKKLLS